MSTTQIRPTDAGHDVEDDVLLHLVRQGDTEAFGTLYERHVRGASMTAFRTGARGHDTEDVVADAFVRVLRALVGGNGPTDSFTGYLSTAVRRVAWSSSDHRGRHIVTDDLSTLDEAWHDDTDSLAATPVGQAMKELPAEWRDLLWRIEVLGEKAADIASERGCSPNAVSAAASRARRRLRALYLEQGDDYLEQTA